MFYLDKNAKLQKVIVNNWYNGLWPHWGRYGSWTMFNVDPMDQRVVVDHTPMYMGNGMDYRWHIKFSMLSKSAW